MIPWMLGVAAAGRLAYPCAAVADEDDWEVSARAGVSSVVVDGRDPLGLGLGLDLQYGLDDAWAARISTRGGRYGVSGDRTRNLPDGTIWSYSAFAGINYTMDVLRLLPTFEVAVGYLGLDGAVRAPHRTFGIQVGIGAEYLLTPRFTVGAVAEYLFAPFDLASNVLNGSQTPQAFAFSVRLGWILH
jgi:opacity protein-like surface antigen